MCSLKIFLIQSKLVLPYNLSMKESEVTKTNECTQYKVLRTNRLAFLWYSTAHSSAFFFIFMYFLRDWKVYLFNSKANSSINWNVCVCVWMYVCIWSTWQFSILKRTSASLILPVHSTFFNVYCQFISSLNACQHCQSLSSSWCFLSFSSYLSLNSYIFYLSLHVILIVTNEIKVHMEYMHIIHCV